MDINEKFRWTIVALRRNNVVKITQTDIALEAGLSPRYYQDLEAGKKKTSLVTVNKIAHAHSMKLSDLCKLIEEMD